MKEKIGFGTAFTVDGLGFVMRGTVELLGDVVCVSGRRHWSLFARVGLYLIFAIPILWGAGIFATLLVSPPVLTLIHYLATSRESLRFPRLEIAMPSSDGRIVTMHVRDPRSREHVKCVFRAKDADTATQIVSALTITQPSALPRPPDPQAG